MTAAAERQTVLARMARGDRPAAGGSAVTAETVVETALIRAAEAEWRLRLAVSGVTTTRQSAAEIGDTIAENALICLLSGPEETTGLCVLPFETLSGFVSQAMTGQLPARPPEPRPATRVDAQIVRGMVDQVLAGLGELPGQTPGFAAAFRYQGMVADARLVRFSLPDGALSCFDADLRLGAAQAGGSLRLCLPDAPKPAAQSAARNGDWRAALRAGVLHAPVPLVACLTRLHLPVNTVEGLRIGQELRLSAQAIERVTLEAAGGAVLARGKLGQARGDRAIRLSLPGGEIPAVAVPPLAPTPDTPAPPGGAEPG